MVAPLGVGTLCGFRSFNFNLHILGGAYAIRPNSYDSIVVAFIFSRSRNKLGIILSANYSDTNSY